jgi:cytochrome P450
MGESDSVRVPTVDELKQMDYLNMVIKESTRCMSAAPAAQRRATKSFTLSNGVEIPEGRAVTLHMWGLFHNPKYFPEPNKFDPERFRDPNCEANKNWIPFIAGARTCKKILYIIY